ncbi:styrene-oxide isomerase StyC [Cupriavidus pinatubonensis]|uniref:styrene-oxide isomerase StyC n=1 Tax=Cupriavidus pinatubonensis TaxID=248026 RepID=UPI0011274F55|nr:hypothetical protein [Cupriavidus pinatubonensis]TPQ33943.1 hypothetical protein C2U69_23765 [Cupriavidus pinatubonensis]
MIVAVQRSMVGHAMLILFIGMIAGMGLLSSLIGGVEWWPGKLLSFQLPGPTDAWVRTHLGGMLNAFLILLVALVLPILQVNAQRARVVGWLFVCTGWANTVFYWAAIFSANRALTFGDNRFGASSLFSVIGLIPGLVFAIVSLIAVFLLACAAFSSRSDDSRAFSTSKSI